VQHSHTKPVFNNRLLMFRFICELCSFYIATHPEVEAKIVEELAAAGLLATPQQPRPRPLAYDDLAGLTYLGAAIKVRVQMRFK